MYIIHVTSKATHITMYFTGYIIHSENKHIVEQTWSVERRFATRFKTEALADTIADAFRKNTNNYIIAVEYEVE